MTPAGRATIVSNVVIVAALVPALWGFRYPMPLPYVAHKMLHIFGVTMLVGNMSVGPLWLLLAWRANDPKLLQWCARVLALADLVFTLPGAHLTLWNGLAMASVFGGVRAQTWLYQTALLLLATSVLAPTVVLYYQEKMLEKAEQLAPREEFNALLYRWSFWGTLVMFPFGAALYTMVAKHGLW